MNISVLIVNLTHSLFVIQEQHLQPDCPIICYFINKMYIQCLGQCGPHLYTPVGTTAVEIDKLLKYIPSPQSCFWGCRVPSFCTLNQKDLNYGQKRCCPVNYYYKCSPRALRSDNCSVPSENTNFIKLLRESCALWWVSSSNSMEMFFNWVHSLYSQLKLRVEILPKKKSPTRNENWYMFSVSTNTYDMGHTNKDIKTL